MAEYVDKEIVYARLSVFGMNVQKMVTELPRANVKEIVYAHWEKLMEWDITDVVIAKQLMINIINQNTVRIVVLK